MNSNCPKCCSIPDPLLQNKVVKVTGQVGHELLQSVIFAIVKLQN